MADNLTIQYEEYLLRQRILKVTNTELTYIWPVILGYEESQAHKIKVLQNSVASLQATVAGIIIQIAGMGTVVLNEIPSGLIDGVNNVYITAKQYSSGSLMVWYNGNALVYGTDFTESGPSQFTTTFIPQNADNLIVAYKY